MNIITEPSVYLVGASATFPFGFCSFEEDEGVVITYDEEARCTEELVEMGGRLCYMSFHNPSGKTNKEYIENILKLGHGSVLEHATYNLIFTGISRSLTHELIRHRAGFSYSQLSQRYVDESDVAFVLPPGLYDDDKACPKTLWEIQMRTALDTYNEIVTELLVQIQENNPNISKRDLRIQARQAARSVLPNATETKIMVTCNARALRHFLELRGSEQAEPEIRRLALSVLEVVQKHSPHIFGDFTITKSSSGTDIIFTPCSKV